MFSSERKNKKEHGNTAELGLCFYLLSNLLFQICAEYACPVANRKVQDRQIICAIELVYMKQSSRNGVELCVSQDIQVINDG